MPYPKNKICNTTKTNMVDIDSMPIVGLPDAKNERPCKKKRISE